MMDPVLSKETLFIEPGIGNFGGEYEQVVYIDRCVSNEEG